MRETSLAVGRDARCQACGLWTTDGFIHVTCRDQDGIFDKFGVLMGPGSVFPVDDGRDCCIARSAEAPPVRLCPPRARIVPPYAISISIIHIQAKKQEASPAGCATKSVLRVPNMSRAR